MYKRTKHKRRRIKILRFFELIVLPIITAIIILFFFFVVAVSLFGVTFSSAWHMIGIISLIVLFIGGVLFEISREIIKKILKK